LPKSITISPSDTAGARPKPEAKRSWRQAIRRLVASLTLKTVALVAIFVALPVVLYGQFESADRQMRDLVTRAIQDRSALISEALAPKLTNGDKNARAALNDDLAKYASDGTILKLMFQPGEERHAGRFYFVASAPKIRFGDVAAEISQGRIGDNAFSHRNVVPELSSVARDFDKLVHDLRRVSQQIRQNAEDKAHSFKTPLATIRSALEPVRRAMPLDNARAKRALEIVDSSLKRLLDLVIAAQRHDISTAELIEAPRVPTDFTQLVGDAALHFREILATKDIRLIRRLEERAIVRAGQGMLETVLQCVLENAISFSPRGGTIIVTLTVNSETVELQVDDEGPGVDPAKIPHMFERYFSSRPEDDQNAPPSGHAGLGLWIVRRNLETLGGRVSAANRIGGGLSISISLPRNGA
jgi:signal transduction histidine kinase